MQWFAASLWVGIGGILGANARFWLARAAAAIWGTGFPWGTMIINVSGSFAIGLIYGLLASRLSAFAEQIRLAVLIGFLGSFTTFSTFEHETHALMMDGEWLLAAANVAGSVVAGLIAVYMGNAIAGVLSPR